MKSLRVRAGTLAVVLTAAMFAGCATVQTPTKEDPFEGFNRTIFTFNDKVDQYALKPVAQGYVKITPQPVRDSVTNFFSNIGDVYTAANNFLQLKITDGVEDVMRLAINTLFGVGGLFDVATQAGLPKHNQDLGLTLGHYGVPPGPYLVLPLFGPSTVRDAVGSVGNYYINPLTYVQPDSVSWGLYALNIINTRANLLGAGDLLAGAALDKYSFVRNAYLQRRRYQLSDGKASTSGDDQSLPKYDDVDTGAPAAGAAGAAGAATTGTGTAAQAATPASGASAATAAAATATAAPATGASAASGVAIGASPASEASGVQVEQPAVNGGPDTQVPAGSIVPPARFGYPSLKLH
jgi:phospholipid-binding lipoprotein MlaA